MLSAFYNQNIMWNLRSKDWKDINVSMPRINIVVMHQHICVLKLLFMKRHSNAISKVNLPKF